MESEATSSTEQPQGLPPVTPPSGRFLAQLFLVPGMIVLLAVLLLLLFRNLFGSGHTPTEFLRLLDNPNPDIRWRGASDLAQVLGKRESLPLQTDVDFALDLSARLDDAVTDLDAQEKTLAPTIEKLPKDQQASAWIKLRNERKYVRFLTAAVGRLHAPVAYPVLAKLVLRKSPDVNGNTLIRRQALWSIGILGSNAQDFNKLAPEYKSAVLAKLKEKAKNDSDRRALWARTGLYYLSPSETSPGAAGDDLVQMDEVLARCADSDDPYFRELTALALLFFQGDEVEPTLLKLAHDDGHGELVRVDKDD